MPESIILCEVCERARDLLSILQQRHAYTCL